MAMAENRQTPSFLPLVGWRRAAQPGAMHTRMEKASQGLRELVSGYVELTERRMILDRPWTHDELHWVADDEGELHLHGRVPGRPGGRGPVTHSGWCPCRRSNAAAA